jgi:hypothetical protein
MNENNYHHHGNERPDRDWVHRVQHLPHWKRTHRVWAGLFFMFVAITIYVLSNDLAFPPYG